MCDQREGVIMKESYLTPENIDVKSKKWFQRLAPYREKHKMEFQHSNSALLVIDMQRYFLNERSHAYIPSAPAILPKLVGLTNAFLKSNLAVFMTRHIDEQGTNSAMKRWWKELITEHDILSEIVPELRFPKAIVLRKSQYDAFYLTPLEKLLRERGIEQVVITGVMTHLCCETTARSAFVRGFDVLFAIDGTATYNEDFHWATLNSLSHGFATPVLCEELMDRMGVSSDNP